MDVRIVLVVLWDVFFGLKLTQYLHPRIQAEPDLYVAVWMCEVASRIL